MYSNQFNSQCNGYQYLVEKDDNLYKISRKLNVSLDDIFYANPDVNVYNLQVGDILCIPNASTSFYSSNTSNENNNMYSMNEPFNSISSKAPYKIYVVKDNDTLENISNKTGITISQLIDANSKNGIHLKEGSILNIPQT